VTSALSGPKRKDLPPQKRKSVGPSRKATKVGLRSRQRFPVEPWRFREARLTVGLGIERCADLLHVSERTIRNWEAGIARVPYAAYKLMRVMRGGKILGPHWRGFHVWHDTLVTPEGHRFHFGDLAWWSLLVRQARQWQRDRADLKAADVARGRQAAGMSPADSPALLDVHGEPVLQLRLTVDETSKAVPVLALSSPRAAMASSGIGLQSVDAGTSASDIGLALGEQGRGTKPLKNKKNLSDSLSLTLPVRPKSVARRSKAVRP